MTENQEDVAVDAAAVVVVADVEDLIFLKAVPVLYQDWMSRH